MTISNERFQTLFLNWWKMSEKDFTLSDMEDICKEIGMTRGEFIELVSQSGEFIDKNGWLPEPEDNKRVNTEDVPIGDTDQAIFETALTQIGIPYSWEVSRDGNGGWINLKSDYGGTAAVICFTKEGKLKGTY